MPSPELPPPLRETRELGVLRSLDASLKKRLDAGQHFEVAQELLERQELQLAAWVHEQIWDFERSAILYREIRHYKDALRCGLMSRDDALLARVVEDIESDPELSAQELRQLAQWLHDKRRPEHAASLWALLKQASVPLAQALEESGDHLAACKALLDAHDPAGALDRIEERPQGERSAVYDALAAQALWELGDVEQSAHLAQLALARGIRDKDLLKTLARALVSLSYPIGAETILGEIPGTQGALGRYRATGVLSSNFAGSAYSAMDRRHLQEVEVHLLLGDRKDAPQQSQSLLRDFELQARAGHAIGHPAIRPIIALDPRNGLMVLGRSGGPLLSQLIRPPGLQATPSRVIAIVLRICNALLAAQAHGLNHGSLLPSQIATDAAGRPVVGPFGAQLLSGLTATRTTSLDELIYFTAPEHRLDRAASEPGDVYALGKIFTALWFGSNQKQGSTTPLDALPWVVRHACSESVEKRPSLQVFRDALRELRFDTATLSAHAREGAKRSSASEHKGGAWAPPQGSAGARAGIRVDCHPSCSQELLDALCERSSAACQSILDREGRRLWLAPWPAGTRRHHSSKDAHAALGAAAYLPEQCPPTVQEEFLSRIRPADWVILPSGEISLELLGPLGEAFEAHRV